MSIKQLNIRIEEEDFTFIKTFAAANKLTLQTFILSAIKSKIAEMSSTEKITVEHTALPLAQDEKEALSAAISFFASRDHLKAENVTVPADFITQVKSGRSAESIAKMLGYTKQDWDSMP